MLSDSQSGDDVDVSNGDFLDKDAVSSEDLHSTSFISSITNDKFGRLTNDGDFPRIPQLSLFFAWNAELIFVFAILLEDLNSMIVGIGHDDFFVDAQTKSVWSIELTFLWAQRTEFRSDLHRLTGATCHHRG